MHLPQSFISVFVLPFCFEEGEYNIAKYQGRESTHGHHLSYNLFLATTLILRREFAEQYTDETWRRQYRMA